VGTPHTIGTVKLARELERRLERLVDGATAAVFGGTMHPVDLAERLVRQVDFLQWEGPAGPQVPNHLAVLLHPSDLDPGLPATVLTRELALAVATTAAERGWRLGGPVVVGIDTDPSVPRGIVDVHGDTRPGRLEPWGQLISLHGDRFLPLADNRIRIGRALDNDAIISVPEVSRHHALVVRDGEGVHLRDLESSNGTFHNGTPLTPGPARLAPGDEVAFGDRAFSFRML